MEAANFEELRHRRFGKLQIEIRPLPESPQEDLRTINNAYIPPHALAFQFQQVRINDDKIISPNLPTLGLQLQLHTHEEYWYLTPHDYPPQFLYIDEYEIIETSSVHLKLCPSEYMSYDMLYHVLQENLKNWCDNSKNPIHALIHQLIGKIHKSVNDELDKGTRQNLELLVEVAAKVDYVCDGRLCLQEAEAEEWSRFNGGMVPASKSSIMQLTERMEIDEDQCLNDNCVICFESLGEDGKKILCMPCSHIFHGDCITKWLDKSHFCPVCRFDLPTTE